MPPSVAQVGPESAKMAARLRRDADILQHGGVRQDGGDLNEIVQGHAGSHELRFEILPSKAALLDDVIEFLTAHGLVKKVYRYGSSEFKDIQTSPGNWAAPQKLVHLKWESLASRCPRR